MWPKLLHSTESYASTSQISYNLKLHDHSTITLTMIQEGVLPPAGSPTQKIETVVVDPAGLRFIGKSVVNAGGASGAIYDHFGIKQLGGNGALKVAEAWLGEYEKGKVIHVVSPDLTDLTRKEAIDCLTDAYHNVFQESLLYARTLKEAALVLRLLPISSGINARSFSGDIHKITWCAVTHALNRMDGEMGKMVQVMFCIHTRYQYDLLKQAIPFLTISQLFCEAKQKKR